MAWSPGPNGCARTRTACSRWFGRHSPPGQLFSDGREADALAALRDWRRGFGDNLHLELTRCGLPGEDEWNAFALHAAGTLGLPVVASNDVRFLDREGFEAHDARVCIASGRVLDDTRRPHDHSAAQYLKSAEEMAALFADARRDRQHARGSRDAATSSSRSAPTTCPRSRCRATRRWKAGSAARRARAWRSGSKKRRLRKGRRAGLRGAAGHRTRRHRQDGFPGYFLIVADFINWAKDHGIPVGPGRGSGAGSLVAWALGITDLDPLPYDLLFERFLNPNACRCRTSTSTSAWTAATR